MAEALSKATIRLRILIMRAWGRAGPEPLQDILSGNDAMGSLCHGCPSCRAACSVFFISMAIVIGPTPPGTGVIAAHFGATSA